MKRSLEILGALLVGVLVVAGCVGVLVVAGCGGGPTQPKSGGGGGGDPADADISGAWNGTVTDLAGTCNSENFSVSLSQSAVNANGFQGGKAVGSFSTPCGGEFSLQLYVKGDNLFGSVSGKGHVSGSVSGSSLSFAILSGQGGLDGGQVSLADITMTR